MKAQAVIPSNRTRKITIRHDAVAHKQRNRIERCFNQLKYFRCFATRYERRTIHFAGFTFIAATMIWLCCMSIRPSSLGRSTAFRHWPCGMLNHEVGL